MENNEQPDPKPTDPERPELKLPDVKLPDPKPAGASRADLQESVFYEGGPARGDLILNLLFGLTLIGIPFAVGAIVRALWLRFRITSRRISVSGGWLGRDRTQVVYSQIREVRSVPRGLGAWGDMVLVLNDGAKLEMRAVPRFRELEAYIAEQRQRRGKGASRSAGATAAAGFAPPARESA